MSVQLGRARLTRLRNELCSDSFHAALAWSCGRAKFQCCTALVTVVVYIVIRSLDHVTKVMSGSWLIDEGCSRPERKKELEAPSNVHCCSYTMCCPLFQFIFIWSTEINLSWFLASKTRAVWQAEREVRKLKSLSIFLVSKRLFSWQRKSFYLCT